MSDYHLQPVSSSSHSTHLEGVVQPVHGDRVDGADHLQDAVEVVELLENLQDLDDP